MILCPQADGQLNWLPIGSPRLLGINILLNTHIKCLPVRISDTHLRVA